MKAHSDFGDVVFTTFAGLCAVVATVIFIAIGSSIARATFSGHEGGHEAPTEAAH